MDLSEMADFVCGKVRQTDAEAIAACKGFLRQRHELIYNDALWRDSLYLFNFTFTPDAVGVPASWDATKIMPSVVDKVVGIRRADAEITAAGQEVLLRGNIDQWAETGDPVQFATLAPCVALLPEDYATHDVMIQAAAADAGIAWSASIIDADGNRQRVEGTFDSGATIIHSDARVVERVSKASTSVDASLFTNAAEELIATCEDTVSAFPKLIPVRFLPAPTAATVFSALVKKKVLHLEDDGDSPELRNIDQCLIAFAQGDMWERARQIGKAQGKFQEAGALLDQLKRLHAWQEQSLPRYIPEVSEMSGDAGSGTSTKGWW